jgi:ABC-type Co2+ transport system permease subunit
MYAKLFARDLGIVAAAALLFLLGAGFSAGTGAVADLSGVVTGVALGICPLLLHEWGHFLGARATRSVMQPAASLRAIFSFSFDSQRNSLRHFLAMTFGGWLGTALAVFVAYAWLPDELLATRVARGMVLVSVLLVVVTEIPLLARAIFSGRLPPVETGGARQRAEQAPA